MEKQNKLDKILSGAMSSLNQFVDANSIVGSTIEFEDGSKIIPISKVTTGYINGGGEYGEVKILKPDSGHQFAGGNGAIVCLKPTGFVLYQKGKIRFLPISDKPYEKLIDILGEMVGNFTENKDEISY